MKLLALALLCLCPSLLAQAVSSPDPWKSLAFLQGTWDAKSQGPAGTTTDGTYTFGLELNNHVMARHGGTAACKAAGSFDCDHTDLFYIYQNAPNQPLKAIYFDNEGHVIHYNVSTPTATSVVFLSDTAQPGPQFRLTYELTGSVMAGKFQMHMPGQSEWRSYLEWSGAKQ